MCRTSILRTSIFKLIILESCSSVTLSFIMIHSSSLDLSRLYLVLIKAKQEALKSFHSLEPFQPIPDALGRLDAYPMEEEVPLTPKALIKKYQLEKSQLAFTLCTTSNEDGSLIPQWHTTVFSTVLTGAKTLSVNSC